MTLLAYQQALSDLVASPNLCLSVRENASAALTSYDLTERERQRLAAVVWQKGMSTSCSLYRVNRMTPIFTYLPLTCFLLADALIREAELFWEEGAPSDLQFGPETERFAKFLARRLAEDAIDDPYVKEVLAFELAINSLRVASRAPIDQMRPTGCERDDADLQLHPLARIVRFDHDPLTLLESLGERRFPEVEERGIFFLLLDARDGDVKLSQIEPGYAMSFEGAGQD